LLHCHERALAKECSANLMRAPPVNHTNIHLLGKGLFAVSAVQTIGEEAADAILGMGV